MKKLLALSICVLLGNASTGALADEIGVTFNIAADRQIVLSERVMEGLIWNSKPTQDHSQDLDVAVDHLVHDPSSNLYTATVLIAYDTDSGIKAATALARAMAADLRGSLDRAYEDARDRLDRQLHHCLDQREEARQARERLNKLGFSAKVPASVTQHLDARVDLSELQPEVSAAEAFDILRQCVDPPLSMVVIWKELLDMGDIEPVTPIDMDGLPDVRLGTALKLVLKSLSGGFCELSYHVEDDVVVVSTQEDASLDEQYRLAVAKLEPVERVFSRLQDLRLQKDAVEMSTVQTRARTAAIAQAIVQINDQINKALKTDPMVAKLEPLLKPLEEQVHALQDRTPEEYMSILEKLVSIRTRFAEHQMDVIAKSGGAELSRLNKELTQLTIDLAGDQAQLNKLNENLVRVEQELAAVTSLESRVNEIRFAEKALQEAQARVSVVEKEYNALQSPQVTVLGLE
jgi:hypothetical protein